MAERTLTAGDPQEVRALVPVLRKAVDRVTRALAYLDDSSGVIGQDLRDLMAAYARACRAVPPPPAPLAARLVALVWDGPGWPDVKLADFAPALGPKGLARVGDLVTERVTQRVAERAAGVAPDRWRDQWAAQHLREQLAQLIGDVDHYVGVLAEDLTHADRYRMIAAALQDAGRFTEAVDWARRSLADRPSSPHGDKVRDLLVDLLIAVGDLDAAVQKRRSDFQRRPIATTYQALQDTTAWVGLAPGPVIEWALDILRAQVADDPRFAPHLVTVLVADDRQDEVWSVACIHAGQLGEAQYVELLALRGHPSARRPRPLPGAGRAAHPRLPRQVALRTGSETPDTVTRRPSGPRRRRRMDPLPRRTARPTPDPSHLPAQARRLADQDGRQAQARQKDDL